MHHNFFLFLYMGLTLRKSFYFGLTPISCICSFNFFSAPLPECLPWLLNLSSPSIRKSQRPQTTNLSEFDPSFIANYFFILLFKEEEESKKVHYLYKRHSYFFLVDSITFSIFRFLMQLWNKFPLHQNYQTRKKLKRLFGSQK